MSNTSIYEIKCRVVFDPDKMDGINVMQLSGAILSLFPPGSLMSGPSVEDVTEPLTGEDPEPRELVAIVGTNVRIMRDWMRQNYTVSKFNKAMLTGEFMHEGRKKRFVLVSSEERAKGSEFSDYIIAGEPSRAREVELDRFIDVLRVVKTRIR